MIRQGFTLLFLTVISSILPPAYSGDSASARTIIDRALRAGGNPEKIGEFRAVSFKGQITEGGTKVRFDGIFASPTLFKMEFDRKQSGRFALVADEKTLWVQDGIQPAKAHRLSPGQYDYDAMLMMSYSASLPDRLLALKGEEFRLTFIGERKANGVEANAIRVSHKRYRDVVIYFDKSNGLPIKSQWNYEDNLSVPLEMFYEAYKTVGGVRHFTKLRIRRGEEIMQIELIDIKLLKAVNRELFKNPG